MRSFNDALKKAKEYIPSRRHILMVDPEIIDAISDDENLIWYWKKHPTEPDSWMAPDGTYLSWSALHQRYMLSF